jgi:hypothetical protein
VDGRETQPRFLVRRGRRRSLRASHAPVDFHLHQRVVSPLGRPRHYCHAWLWGIIAGALGGPVSCNGARFRRGQVMWCIEGNITAAWEAEHDRRAMRSE